MQDPSIENRMRAHETIYSVLNLFILSSIRHSLTFFIIHYNNMIATRGLHCSNRGFVQGSGGSQ
jgi:hypothetical protein